MDPNSPKKDSKQSGKFLKYTGLAFQILITLGVLMYLGYLIDQQTGWKIPLFVILFMFLGLAGVIYKLYKDIEK